jgi:hypothetical protein
VRRGHRLIAIDKRNVLVSGEPLSESVARNAAGCRLAEIKNGYLYSSRLRGRLRADAYRHG